MTTDLDEQLGYDADHDDPSQYCIHGTWIGSWWGPDYLCGYCEMGVTVKEMQIAAKRAKKRRAVREMQEYEKIRKLMQDMVPTHGFDTRLAGLLIGLVEQRYFRR
jgi:hypothetical protein